MDIQNKQLYVPLGYRRFVLNVALTFEDFVKEEQITAYEIEQYARDTWKMILRWRQKYKLLKNPKFAGFLKGME